jgi:hypothetical protein
MAGFHPMSANERQNYWHGFAAAVSFLRSVRLEGYTTLEQAEQMARRFQADIQARFEPGTVDFGRWREKIGVDAAILQHSPKDGFTQAARYPEVFRVVASDLRSQDPVTRRKAENQVAANELAALMGAAPVNVDSYNTRGVQESDATKALFAPASTTGTGHQVAGEVQKPGAAGVVIPADDAFDLFRG